MNARDLELNDTTERLGPDDMATLREAQHLQAALLTQAAKAQASRGTPGLCSNCSAQCHPSAVYCDDDCRSDHEHRESILARQGRR